MFENIVLWAIIIFVAFILVWYFILRGIVVVRHDEVGIVTRMMFGEQMPQGQIIACKGEVGIQADTLMPKIYWRFPVIWRIEKDYMIKIKTGEIGLVTSVDGKPIPIGRLLGDEVPCNSFQDAKVFLTNGGCKGPQVAILPPGVYRINTKVFTVIPEKATTVSEKKIGIVIAEDGIPLPSEYNVAPEPEGNHNHFQNGQAFITNKGYRGPQLETLQPGISYINTRLFKIKEEDVTEVSPGYVAVIRSNIGKDVEQPKTRAPEVSIGKEADEAMGKPLQTDEVLLTSDKKTRGIWEKALTPSVYNLNTLALTAYPVPTSAITINWALEGEFEETPIKGIEARKIMAKGKGDFSFDPVAVTTSDGFILKVNVQLILRIDAVHAPYVISRFGTITNLIEQIAHPLIESSFRNEAGEKEALQFVSQRTALQKSSLEKAQTEFRKHYVEVQNLLIGNIITPGELLDTQTKKQIAVQEKLQYDAQGKAEEQRITVQEKKARAEKQKDVIDAKLAIEIAEDRANAARMEADGIRDATMAKAAGDAFKERTVGEAKAAAYEAQIRAFGRENLTAIKITEAIADGKIKIVPDILVAGGGEGGITLPLVNAGLTGIIAAQLPQLMAGKQPVPELSAAPVEKPDSAEKKTDGTKGPAEKPGSDVKKPEDIKVPELPGVGDKVAPGAPSKKK